MITIRPATKADCPAMMQLINELAIFEKAPNEVTVTLPHFEESGFGPNPVWWAFVAIYQNQIVGMALYYIRYSTWKGQKMYLEDIVVAEPYRRMGVGGRLMDRLISEAQEKSFSGISWQVLDWNESAINFYKKYQTKFDSSWINVGLDF